MSSSMEYNCPICKTYQLGDWVGYSKRVPAHRRRFPNKDVLKCRTCAVTYRFLHNGKAVKCFDFAVDLAPVNVATDDPAEEIA